MEKRFGVVYLDLITNKPIRKTFWVASMEEAKRIAKDYNYDGCQHKAYAVDITPEK